MNLPMWIVYVIFPYMMFLIFLMGLIWKYDQFEENETGAKESLSNWQSHIFLGLFVFVIGTGLIAKGLGTYEQINHMTKWFTSLVTFQPEMDWMLGSTWLFKIHGLLLFSLLGLLPFTKYINYITFPFIWGKQVLLFKNPSVPSLEIEKDQSFNK